jgi:hypothetical protein
MAMEVRLNVNLRDMNTNLWRFRVLIYSELSKEIEQLSYRDKFRLAQLLIQLARKEEEEQNTEHRQKGGPSARLDPDLVQYVADRLQKLKPSKKNSLFNSMAAMFQFQGGLSDGDKERMFSELQKRGHIVVAENGRVQYPRVIDDVQDFQKRASQRTR